MSVFVTGAAGFIGMHVCLKLLKKGNTIIGVDNLNSYYSVKLKQDRLSLLKKYKKFYFYKCDLNNKKKLNQLFNRFKPNIVLNMAAQAGVRYSINHPEKYLRSNINGFFNILSLSEKHKVKKIIFASSSSVYGLKNSLSNQEYQATDKPLSFYAATKKSNESMAYTYSHLYKIPIIGIRFFTVYGPWGRPDMALYKFTKKILQNKNIDVYNKGEMYRSFTYIDDVVKAVIKVLYNMNKLKSKKVPFKILNIGSNKSEKLSNFIRLLEKNLKKNAKKNYLPIQMGDTNATKANLKELKKFINFIPNTKIEIGIKNFIVWYKKYMNII